VCTTTGFNNISTYGNLRRLILEGKTPFSQHELNYTELALKVSGRGAGRTLCAHRLPAAMVARRRLGRRRAGGYVYSFNGPQSLFADTIRSMRPLVVAHQLGHVLMGEGDKPINLLHRAIEHAATHRAIQRFLRRRPR